MANKNEVTISLEEYKELLLKDKPNDKDSMLLDRIKDLIFDNIKYDKDWNGDVQIDFKNNTKFTEDLITLIKFIDKDLYKVMIKFVCDEKAKKDKEKTDMEKARAIKKLNE